MKTNRAFQNGGKPGSDELMRQMAEKYGLPYEPKGEAAPAPQAPVPQPVAQVEKGGLLQRAAGLMRGRTQAIDKAAGYANGKAPDSGLNDAQLAELSVDAVRQRQAVRHRHAQRQEIVENIARYANGGELDGSPLASTATGIHPAHWSQNQDLANLEKTQRWAAEDLLKKAQSEGTRTGRQALYGLAGQAMAEHRRQFGFANGGSIGKHPLDEQRMRVQAANPSGGKIKGPGTPTSDSIPAQVQETGENILVSNKERIVSAEQDIILERIAEMLGFESVNAMFEELTGKPVGPTIKHTRRAAATGMAPEDDLVHRGIETMRSQLAPQKPAPTAQQVYAGVGNSSSDYDPATVGQPEPSGTPGSTWSAIKSAFNHSSDREAFKARNQPAPYSNEGRVKPTAEAHPFAVPASRPGANVPSSISTDVGNGIRRTVETSKPTSYSNVQPGGQVLDDSASALRDQQSNDPYWTPAAQLERMQRRRLMSDATDPTITDPNVRESAQKGLLLLNATRAAEADITQKGLAANSAKQLASLHGKLLDPKTPVEEQKRIAQALAAMRGHGGEKPAELRTVDVEELIDPKQPLLGTRKVPHVFDPRTGQSRPMIQNQGGGDVLAQAKEAIARGADPKAVNARLRSIGLEEIR